MFDKEKFLNYEKYFKKEHENSFEILKGKGKVMVSAPHSVAQTRLGKLKYSEPQTGALAHLLHDSLNCHVIYKTKNLGDDANFDENCDYKTALCEFVRQNGIVFLIDLHQLSPRRKELINIGTGDLKNLKEKWHLDLVVSAFANQDIQNLKIDYPFKASYPYTVSAYVSKNCGISCIQIELNSTLVRLGYSECQVEKVYNALKEIILKIQRGSGNK